MAKVIFKEGINKEPAELPGRFFVIGSIQFLIAARSNQLF
jgi:hypothetical protein